MTGTPMYRQIYDDLLRGISDGTYPPGCRLPSEKELAEMYSVSRITSKKALEMLADRAVIMRKPGKGSFVLEAIREDTLQAAFFSDDAADPDSRNGRNGDGETDTTTTQRTLIGVILDYFDPSFGVELIQGIEYECRRREADMLLRITYGSSEAEAEAISDMRARGAGAILLMCAQNETYNEHILKLCVEKYPLVLIDRELKGLPVPAVTTDNYGASCRLTEYLIEKGHRNICFLSHSFKNTSTVSERFFAYRDTMSRHLLETDERLWITDMDQFLPTEDDIPIEEQDILKRLIAYIRDNPDVTAFYAVNFRLGNLIWQVLRQEHADEKEVVCFDWINMDELFPVLMTHVEQDQFQMGVTAVRLAIHRMRGEEPAGRTLIPYKFVEK